MRRNAIFIFAVSMMMLTACAGKITEESELNNAASTETEVQTGNAASTETEVQTVDTASAETETQTDDTEDNIGMPNPFVDYDNMEDACEAAGFEMEVPEEIENYPSRSIQVCASDAEDEYSLLQVLYMQEDSSENQICIRKADCTEDISGDYNEYQEQSTESVGGKEVTMSGNDGAVYLATWTEDGYSFSVGVYGGDGLSVSDMTELVNSVK